MSTPDDVGLIETLIIDCGSAAEVANIAARLKHIADYVASATNARNGRLDEAYKLLRTAVHELASVGDIGTEAQLDEAIARFVDDD